MADAARPPARIDVLTADGATFHVRGRAARLIQWLATHEADVNGKKRGELLLRFAGETLSGQLTEAIDGI